MIERAQLEKKVEDYLRNSQALEDYWQRPISAQQLQAEIDRMAMHTKQPDVLRELFKALVDSLAKHRNRSACDLADERDVLLKLHFPANCSH
jgi:hypothetical protein